MINFTSYQSREASVVMDILSNFLPQVLECFSTSCEVQPRETGIFSDDFPEDWTIGGSEVDDTRGHSGLAQDFEADPRGQHGGV